MLTRWANAIAEEASQQQQSTSFTVQELKDIADVKFLSLFSTHITGTYQVNYYITTISINIYVLFTIYLIFLQNYKKKKFSLKNV